jgi:thioredoxin-like negative regulator of GroEL
MLAVNPNTAVEPRAWLHAAFEHLQKHRFAAAAALAGSLVAAAPDDLRAGLVLALALAAQGLPGKAAPLLQRISRARPEYGHPCRDLRALLPDQPALLDTQFAACRAFDPLDPRLALAYADFLHDSGRPEAAAELLVGLPRDQPGLAVAHNRLGIALSDLGEPEAAIAEFRAAIDCAPAAAAPWANLGQTLRHQGEFDAALAAHDAALARNPSDARIRLNRAVALLAAGRLEAAWADFECRQRLSGGPPMPPERLLPSLDPGPDLTGRTVLVTHEEGFGDTVQFARYLPMLAARGARVLAWVPPELTRLLADAPGLAGLVPPDAPPPAFDWHCPFCSLPRAFATTLATIPAQIPYLGADPALAAAWAGRLAAEGLPAGGLRVGLVWAGQARPWLPGFTVLDRRRSTTLASFAPLGEVPGVRFVSLQKGPAAGQARTPPPGLALFDPMARVSDFADTAAIVANLDVVVSVDTAVVHLAGALGKPVLLLNRYDSCWRWMYGRADSPWYPSLRIFRQSRPGDWTPVMAEAARALSVLADRHRAATAV